jgi:hypothetical protein
MTTKDSTARVNAAAALAQELKDLNATNGEYADYMAMWSDLTSGRRPGYYAAHVKVVDEFRAAKGLPALDRPGQSKPAPEPTAPEIDEQAFEAAAPVDAPLTAKEQAKVDAKYAAAEKKAAKAAKAATPKPEKAPARKVDTVKNAPGQFLRQRRLVRRSKTVVAIYDLGHKDSTFGEIKTAEDTVAKYLVVCEDHSQQAGVKNYESAWRLALDPAQCCTECAKAAQA